MGREVKRVPLDFDAPINETWAGYCAPYERCPECKGDGYNEAGKRLTDVVARMMHDRCGHPDWRAFTVSLAGRDIGIIHDAIDRWSAEKKLKRLAKLPKGWGVCKACAGHGQTPESLKLAKRWKRTEAPTGPGWQMWSTTVDGPMSPVFDTAEKLATWLADSGASIFGRDTGTKEEWTAIINAGWIPDMVSTGGKLFTGAAIVTELKGK